MMTFQIQVVTVNEPVPERDVDFKTETSARISCIQ
jgi:hypothetical protein